MSKLLRHLGLLVAGFTAVVVVACAVTEEPAGPTEGAPTASPTQATTGLTYPDPGSSTYSGLDSLTNPGLDSLTNSDHDGYSITYDCL